MGKSIVDRDYEEHLAPNLYFDRTFNMDAVKILPGEYYVSTRDMVIVTVLGSCVSACVRDKLSGIGGMNHFMLPGDSFDTQMSTSARYGVYAMEILINQLLKRGARRDHLEAKVFGGGRVLKGFTISNVGDRNADFVNEFLETERIRIVASDLCGDMPRKVYFFPKSGQVFVRKLRSVHNNTIVDRELEYHNRLRRSSIEGDVELF